MQSFFLYFHNCITNIRRRTPEKKQAVSIVPNCPQLYLFVPRTRMFLADLLWSSCICLAYVLRLSSMIWLRVGNKDPGHTLYASYWGGLKWDGDIIKGKKGSEELFHKELFHRDPQRFSQRSFAERL